MSSRRPLPWLPCLAALTLGAGAIVAPAAQAAPRGRVLESWRIARDSRRFEILATERLWEVLAIRPGMTVLDIGTGTGQFAYAFAGRLRGSGKVYASDIDARCVAYVREEAARRGLTNVFPGLVQQGRVDDFYRADSYDLVALFHVGMDHAREGDLLSHLRGSLRDGGRLILLQAKIFPDFSPADFQDDREGLAQAILQEPAGTPFFRAVRESTRAQLRTPSGAGYAGGWLDDFADDLNRVLGDANFGLDFLDGETLRRDLALTPEEREYAEWLTIPHNIQGLARGIPRATWVSARNARMINKLLVLQKYRKHLRGERMYAPGLTPAARAAFERAGYALHGEYRDLVPFDDVIVFTRGR